MLHSCSLSDPWFGHIKSGAKIYEGRRWWAPTQRMKVGDTIAFKSRATGEICPKRIKKIVVYDSFETALQIVPLQDILPGVKTIAEGVKLYEKFVSLDTQSTDGVCIIELDCA